MSPTVPISTAGPPVSGLRERVSAAAGSRCECAGECGRSHRDRRSRQPGPARCLRTDEAHAPLHAIPREPVSEHEAGRLPAADLLAACAGCADGITRSRARAAAPAPACADLFALDGAA